MVEPPRRVSRSGLSLCPSCGRHIHFAEATCPFCAERVQPATASGLARAGRAGVLAGVLLAAPGCGDDASPGVDATPDTKDVAGDIDAGDADADVVGDIEVVEDATIVPLYAPPPQDAR